MTEIAHISEGQDSIVKILYKNNQGTGFYVTENLIVSAYHTFIDLEVDESEIKIFKKESEIKGEILKIDRELDLCLISVKETCKESLLLYSSSIKINEYWMTFGYPFQGEQSVNKFHGKVSHYVQDEKCDFILHSEGIDSNFDYSGLSGAPVLSNGGVIGIILKQLDNNLGAVSINKVEDFLISNNISIQKEKDYRDLPNQFIEDVETSVYNDFVLKKMEDSISKEGKWILMKGNPGSGKSLNVATFSSNNNISVLGKYFIKVPNDNTPKALRTSPIYFLKWLEDIISFTLYGKPFPKENKSFEEKVERLARLLNDLNAFYKAKSKIGVLFIDGLDEIENLNDFLGIFNLALPEKIRIFLSCTSAEILPSSIKNQLDTEQIIEVTPIEKAKCEYFILKEIGRERLKTEYIQQLADKSEGHPLYLRYLTNIIKDEVTLNNDNFNNWIETVPTLDGDIENYYNNIWDGIYQDETKLWISLVVSQLRSPLTKQEVNEILPKEIQFSFLSKFPSIKYLFKEYKDAIEVYHNSFRYFISRKAELYLKKSNDLIVAFCESNQDIEYSLENLLYHYKLSSKPERAINHCNQKWADSLVINHSEPDLILLDIKSTIELSIKLENTTELVRLLLLLQRIEFRYDYVLYEYAQNIAFALIARGKYKQALKYIVRRNILLVSNNNAIHFLQLFYEGEAYEQAHVLSEAIEARFRRLIKDEVTEGKGISIDVFSMKVNALTLSTYENFEQGYLKYMKFKMFLREMYDDSLKNDHQENTNTLFLLREYVASWNQAFMLRSRDIFIPAKEVSKKMNIELDNKWAKMIALSKIIFDEELNQYNTVSYDENNSLKLVEDIEYLIINHDYVREKNEIKTLIESLLEDSKKTSLVENLIKEFLSFEDEEINFRESNGVDFSYVAFKNIDFRFKYSGYVDAEDVFVDFVYDWSVKGWENSLYSLIKAISFIEGKTYRNKSLNNEKGNLLVEKQLKDLLEKINFSFEERSGWDRSYQLPEEIFPILYSKLIKVCYNINTQLLDEFVDSIRNKPNNQMSLYSEGYRALLYKVVKELILIEYNTEVIISLVELWENHILTGVQNRWERTEELLKISEIYGILDLPDKFDSSFYQMINTSMGPTWYKEAQLDLINSTLEYLRNDDVNLNEYLINFASLLDFASGEMTFQRYVRYEKEDFITSLIINKNLNSAIKYLKQEVLPNPELLIQNAEESSFDATSKGNGYNLGARNIVEQNGVLKILESTRQISPYLKWALCQIFTINDDNFRYITHYGKHTSEALNEIEDIDASKADEICKKVAITIADDELNKDDTRSFLGELYVGLTESNIKRMQRSLAVLNIKWGLDGNGESKKEARVNEYAINSGEVISIDDNPTEQERLKLIKNALLYFKSENLSVWQVNWSNEHGRTKKELKKILKDDKETIKVLSDEISNFYENPWEVAREIIWFLEKKLSLSQVEDIYKIINEHFHYIIRPTVNVSEKYLWLEDNQTEEDNNIEIINFLIWLLNHPFESVRNKTFEVLLDLASLIKEKVVLRIIETTLTDAPILSTKTSSKILKEISDFSPDLIKEVLENNPNLINEISRIQHFSIIYNYIYVSNKLKDIGFDKLEIEINNVIPNVVEKVGDVFLEEDYLIPVEGIIEELNGEELLNKEFCERLCDNIENYCSPLEVEEMAKSDIYLRRSFYDEDNYRGRYYDLLDYSINVSIMSRVSKSNLSIINDVLSNV